MSTRSRQLGQNLTADLLADLADQADLTDEADEADERTVPTGATSPIATLEVSTAEPTIDTPRSGPPNRPTPPRRPTPARRQGPRRQGPARRQGPFVETTFFLSARAWQRPSLRWGGSGLTVAAGPVSLRGGRS